MFNRQAKKFSELYPKDLARFNNDEYAAKWLTGIYNPDFKIKCILKDAPDVRTTIGIVNWSEHRRNVAVLSEVF